MAATAAPTQNQMNTMGDIDGKTILRDVRRRFWGLLAIAVSVSLLSFIFYVYTWHPIYTVETTYAVTTRGTNNDLFTNLTSAEYTAGQFTQIINSSALQKRVMEDLGSAAPVGSIAARSIPETNLIILSSTAGQPQTAFRTLKSAMTHYPEITDFIIGNALIKVLISPKIPTAPDNEFHPYRFMILAFLAALAALIAVAAVFSFMKDTVRKGSDVEKKLDTRYLGTICHEDKMKQKKFIFRTEQNSLLINKPTTSFRYVECVYKVARKIQNQMEKNGSKVLLVTSCLENEGKSTVAANLALALSRSGKKTILVDLDLRKPAQFRIFEEYEDLHTDLVRSLAGKSTIGEMVQKVEDEDLYVIFNTRENSQSTELLTNGRLEALLEYLKQNFDYVILDTPPMDAAADPEAIAALADASVCVVREHTSRVRDINDMLDILNSCKAKPVGCIFNDAYDYLGQNLGGYGYGYGYGYRYGYGYGRYGYGRYGYGRYGYGRYGSDNQDRKSSSKHRS